MLYANNRKSQGNTHTHTTTPRPYHQAYEPVRLYTDASLCLPVCGRTSRTLARVAENVGVIVYVPRLSVTVSTKDVADEYTLRH